MTCVLKLTFELQRALINQCTDLNKRNYSTLNKLINPADKDNHLENNWVLINAIIEPNNTK